VRAVYGRGRSGDESVYLDEVAEGAGVGEVVLE
jgi:hypothetical protein